MKVGLDQDFQSPQLKRYKAQGNQWDRGVLLDDPVEFEMVHYVEGQGYVLCTMSRFGKCHFCVHKGEALERYASNLLIYRTDESGQPFNPLGYVLYWWSFPDMHYQQFKVWKKAYGDMRAHDLMIYCTEPKYQKLQISCMPEAWWLMDNTFKEGVAKDFQERGIKDLSTKLGKLIHPDQQLAAIMGQTQQSSGRPSPGFNPAEAVAGVGGSPPPQLQQTGGKPSTSAPVFNGVGGSDELLSVSGQQQPEVEEQTTLQQSQFMNARNTSQPPSMPPQPDEIKGVTPAASTSSPEHTVHELDSLLKELPE